MKFSGTEAFFAVLVQAGQAGAGGCWGVPPPPPGRASTFLQWWHRGAESQPALQLPRASCKNDGGNSGN